MRDERSVLGMYPVVVFEDRYAGLYSRGAWFAVSNGYEFMDGLPRVHWLLEFGPGGDDEDAIEFWGEKHEWIAIGDDPTEAVRRLTDKFEARKNAPSGQTPPSPRP